MELHDGVVEHITHINGTSFAKHFWVLVQHQPTNVSKEEATVGIIYERK